MGGPVALDRDELQAILSLYHLEGPEDFGDVGASSPSYWVRADGRTFFLRVTDNRRLDDMIFEKEVLLHLDRHDLPVPGLVPNVARGTFTPWSTRGRYVSLFEYVPGRRLGVFEIRPRHAQRAGQLCARLHRALASFPRRRPHPAGLAEAEKLCLRLERAVDTRRLARRHHAAVHALSRAVAVQAVVPREDIPAGTVHGDIGLASLRFVETRPTAVVGFERSGTQRWTWDLAAAVLAWGWCPHPGAREGPAGAFDRPRVRSLLRAYHRTRPLSDEEREVLPDELRLVAAHQALTRIARHELRRGRAARPYRDYRHYTRRLEALEDGRAERLVQSSLR